MGVIKRQSIKESVVAYIGVIIGALSVLFIQPYFLSPQEIGLIKILIAFASILTPFILLGTGPVAIKYFPKFNSIENRDFGFISFLLLLPLVGFVILLTTFFTFQESVIQWYSSSKENLYITKYLAYGLPLAFCLAYMTLLQAISKSLLKITVPSILQNIWVRIGVILAIILYSIDWLSLSGLILLIISTYAIAVLAMLVYIKKLGHLFIKPQKDFFKNNRFKEILRFGSFIIFIGLSHTLVNYVDILMVGALKGESKAGIYTIALFIGTVIEIPRRSLFSISTPLIARAFHANDTKQIEYLYKSVSINLLIVGCLLLIGIWVNIDNLYSIMPNGEIYKSGKYVVLFIGLSKLFNMVTSLNGEIIVNSPHYRFILVALIFLAALTIVTNLYFIPRFDIVGAAIASLITLVFFNFSKLIFIYYKLMIHPFTANTFKVIGIAVIVYCINLAMPTLPNPFIDIVLRSLLVGGLYIGLIVATHVSTDFNNIVKTVWHQVIKL